MTEPTLLCCPFCGDVAREENTVTMGSVFCKGCGASISRQHSAASDCGVSRAIAAWNRRVPAPAVPPAEQEPVSWIANCCVCGRIIDTREMKDGGDKFGAAVDEYRWACSSDCWEAAPDTAQPPPVPAVPDDVAERLDEAVTVIAKIVIALGLPADIGTDRLLAEIEAHTAELARLRAHTAEQPAPDAVAERPLPQIRFGVHSRPINPNDDR